MAATVIRSGSGPTSSMRFARSTRAPARSRFPCCGLRAPTWSTTSCPRSSTSSSALPHPVAARARRLPPGQESGDRRGSLVLPRAPATDRARSCSRADPSRPLPLARLRARGELAEIDAQQLRFSEEDADLFLNDLHGLGLDRDDVIRLRELTEGWAAGLYLATLAIRDRASAHEFVEAFAGDDRHVVDYLSSEVLAGLSEETRSFLLETSVLGAPVRAPVRRRHRPARLGAGAARARAFELLPHPARHEA